MIDMGSCETFVVEFKSCMMKEFEMSDLGILQYFLSLQVKQVEYGIFVSQRSMQKTPCSSSVCITVKQQPHP